MAFGVPNIASAGVAVIPDFGSFRGQLEAGLRQNLAGPGLAAAAGIAGLAVAAAGFADQAVDAFLPFENSLSKIVGLTGTAQAQVDEWGRDILTLGPQFAKSAQEMGDALLFIASSGLQGAAAMDALEKSAKASAAGLGATETVADAVTSAINAYGPAVLTAGEATDILVATVREGKAEAEQLAGSIGAVIPIAAQMGVSFDQVGGAVAAMTLRGLDAAGATTALRGILVALLNPSAQAEERLDALGLTFADLRQKVRDEGLLDTLVFLEQAFRGNEEAMSDVFDDVRGLTGVLNLVGAGAEQTRAVMDDLANSAGSLDDAFAAVADDEGFKMRQALEEINSEMIEAGERIVPNLVLALKAIAPVVVNDVIPTMTDLAVSFARLAESPLFKIGANIFSTTARGLGVLGDTFGLVVAAVQPWNREGVEAAKTALRLDTAIEDVIHTMANEGDVVSEVAQNFLELAQSGEVTIDHLEQLAAAGRLTQDEIALVGRAFITAAQQGQDVGLTLGQLQIIFGQYVPNVAQMVGATDSWVNALARAKGEAGQAGDAMAPLPQLLRDLGIETGDAADEADRLADRLAAAAISGENMSEILLAQANPLFNAVRAFQNLQRTLEEVDEDGERTGDELFIVAAAVLEASAAFAAFNAGAPEEGIAAIAAAAGVLPEEVEAALREVGIIVDEESSRIGSDLVEGIVAQARQLATPLGIALEEALANVRQNVDPIIIPYDLQFAGMTFPTPTDWAEMTGVGAVPPSAWELAQAQLVQTLGPVLR